MSAVNFADADELVIYVNDNSIVKADIVAIIIVDRRWYLFHY